MPSSPPLAGRRAAGCSLARAIVPRLFLLALAAPCIGGAGPAPEYGPDAEAAFMLHCSGPDPMAPEAAACRREMERLQGVLGYPAFLERAHDGPAAFVESADWLVALEVPPAPPPPGVEAQR